jgi:hypothetical protein
MLKSASPKFRPAIVNSESPLRALLPVTCETTGTSCEKVVPEVESRDEIATPMTLASRLRTRLLETHRMTLSELHDVVQQGGDSADAVADQSVRPKFSPVNESHAPPVSGMFCGRRVTAGASKESTPNPVPTTEATVAAASFSCPVASLLLLDKQENNVEVCQDVELQRTEARRSVGE